MLSYERVEHCESRSVPATLRASLLGVVLGLGVTTLLSLGLLAFVWWPQVVTITLLVAVGTLLLPMRTRVVIVADRLDVAFFVCGLRVHRLCIRMADIIECAIRIDQADRRSLLPWHRTSGCTATCFAGNGVSLLLRGYEEVLIGSGDPRRLAVVIEAARRAEEPAAEPPGSVP